MNFFSVLAILLIIAMQVAVTVNILFYKEDIKSSIGWIGLVWLSPVIGTIVYVIFGINRIKRKAVTLKNTGPGILVMNDVIFEEIQKKAPSHFIQLMRLGYHVHPQYFSLDNHIVPIQNGDAAYPMMCECIRNAKKEVLIQSYIFNNDKAGKMILEAAGQAAQNGAKVKILVDGVGKNYSTPNILSAAKKYKDIEVAVFLPSKKPAYLPFVNLRNHRKIMIIDGHTSFFGGMNISEVNLIKNNPKHPVMDVTFKIQGPVIDQLSQIFLDDWTFSKKSKFVPEPFTQLQEKGHRIPARVIPDGPDSDFRKIESLFLGVLSCAQKHVRILTPYFLPEENILSALETASLRGVEIEIVLPSKSNIFGMDWAMWSNYERLIKKGIKIYSTKQPFDHSKIFIADNSWVFIGSSNWDVRSFKLNFECGMECISEEFAKDLCEIIESKKSNGVLRELQTLSFWEKLRNNAFRLLTPYY